MVWLVWQGPGYKGELLQVNILVQPIPKESMTQDALDRSAILYGILSGLVTRRLMNILRGVRGQNRAEAWRIIELMSQRERGALLAH